MYNNWYNSVRDPLINREAQGQGEASSSSANPRAPSQAPGFSDSLTPRISAPPALSHEVTMNSNREEVYKKLQNFATIAKKENERLKNLDEGGMATMLYPDGRYLVNYKLAAILKDFYTCISQAARKIENTQTVDTVVELGKMENAFSTIRSKLNKIKAGKRNGYDKDIIKSTEKMISSISNDVYNLMLSPKAKLINNN